MRPKVMSKVAGVGSTATLVVGLVLILVLLAGLATIAFVANSHVSAAATSRPPSVKVRGDINGNPANFGGILEHSEGAVFLNTGFRTVVAHAAKGPPVDVLLSCPSQTSAGTLRVVNKAADFGDSQEVLVDDGSANPSHDTLGQGQSIDKTVSPNGDHFTIRVESVFNNNRMATIELFTEQFGPSVCEAKAHVLYTFAT